MLSTGQHTLTTQPDSDEPYKHCILVKLTDSSARAIEEFLRNKVKRSFLFYQFLRIENFEIRRIISTVNQQFSFKKTEE